MLFINPPQRQTKSSRYGLKSLQMVHVEHNKRTLSNYTKFTKKSGRVLGVRFSCRGHIEQFNRHLRAAATNSTHQKLQLQLFD